MTHSDRHFHCDTLPCGIEIWHLANGRYAVTDADRVAFYWTDDRALADDVAANMDARFWQNRKTLGWQLLILSTVGLLAGLAIAFTA